MQTYNKSNKVFEILEVIASGLPNAFLGHSYKGFKPFGNINSRSRYFIKQRIKKMENDGLLIPVGEFIKMTEKGKQLHKIAQMPEIIHKKTKWDGIWRVISYDIPNKQKSERDHFRRKLEEWNFSFIQRSFWAYPYDCQEEIAILANLLNILTYVIYLKTDYLPNNDKLIQKYKLK